MLLRAFPELNAADEQIGESFEARCARENCIVLRSTTHAEFGPIAHTLSLRAAWGGTERCHIGRRVLGVDDDNFLILNDGRSYSSFISAADPVESLVICFRPELVRETYAGLPASLHRMLDDGPNALREQASAIPEFEENLQAHDKQVTPVLRFIKAHVSQGVGDEAWYEEQLHFLLERMFAHRQRIRARMDAINLSRSVTRREVCRRIGHAVDYMHTYYPQRLTLEQLAREAYLSKYHFLRLFVLVHGMTPITYLQRKRATVALRLMRTTRLSVQEIAVAVGSVRGATVKELMRRWTVFAAMQ